MSGITNPVEKYFKDGLWTFDGTVWRPQSQLFGIRAAYRELSVNDLVSAGNHSYSMTAVPAGQIWVVTTALFFNTASICTYITFGALSDGVVYNVYRVKNPAADQQQVWTGWLPLVADEQAIVGFYGCTLNDYLRAYVNGFKFYVAE